MIVVTLEFPDERVNWIDHLHVSFPDRASALNWMPSLEVLGKVNMQYSIRPDDWECAVCRWKSRPGQRRAARVSQR